MNRDAIIDIRPELNLDSSSYHDIEKFQNKTLRPILKFQHEIIIQLAYHKFPALLNVAQSTERSTYLNKMLNSQPILTQLFTGLIVGFFSTVELSFYLRHIVEINKRIKSMTIERIASHK